jgi:hypothetical protein
MSSKAVNYWCGEAIDVQRKSQKQVTHFRRPVQACGLGFRLSALLAEHAKLCFEAPVCSLPKRNWPNDAEVLLSPVGYPPEKRCFDLLI